MIAIDTGDGVDGASPTEAAGFVNRFDEKTALADALLKHRQRMDFGAIDGKRLHHVLHFHGRGGIGKSRLTKQLANWIRGESGFPEAWGPPPSTSVAAIATWDLKTSHGDLNPVELLVHLRKAIGLIKRSWPAFDLALAAYLRTMEPGQNIDLTSTGRSRFSVTDIVSGFAGDVAVAADVAGGVGGAAFSLARTSLGLARANLTLKRALERHPDLEAVLRACTEARSSATRAAEVAGMVASVLTAEIDALDDSARPLIVVFCDHVERLQIDGGRPGEQLLNRLVARLPYLLFVTSGRHSLEWAQPEQTHLLVKGPGSWPGLVQTNPSPDEPRQHLVGRLSTPDTIELLTRTFATIGVKVADEVVSQLAEHTQGWPLHLDTIARVAQSLGKHTSLTMADLGGPLPVLVGQLIEGAPEDERRALFGGCLMPYFDTALIVETVGVETGSIHRMMRRMGVQISEGHSYPFRVHDEIRRVVRNAGDTFAGGWSASDWSGYAVCALEVARRRFEAAMAADEDAVSIASLALALNIASENAVFEEWLIKAVKRSPTISGLSVLVSDSDTSEAHPELSALLRFVHIMGQHESRERSELLGALAATKTLTAPTAALWQAYGRRKVGDIQVAVDILDRLQRDEADGGELYARQAAITLAKARQYQDAMERASRLSAAGQERLTWFCGTHHGLQEGRTKYLLWRLTTPQSRRYRVEQMASWLASAHRDGVATTQDVQHVLGIAEACVHRYAQAMSWRVAGEMDLLCDSHYRHALRRLEDLIATGVQGEHSRARLMTLRALATGDKSELPRIVTHATTGPWRGGTWIGTEFLLEYLGHPLPPTETQWLEPRDVVRTRWLESHHRVVTRARERSERHTCDLPVSLNPPRS